MIHCVLLGCNYSNMKRQHGRHQSMKNKRINKAVINDNMNCGQLLTDS